LIRILKKIETNPNKKNPSQAERNRAKPEKTQAKPEKNRAKLKKLIFVLK
jgi:hypothetical protein